MRTNRRLLATLAMIALVMVLAVLGVLMASCGKGEPPTTTTVTLTAERTLAPGENWAITESTELDVLTIGEGATITPPEGKSVTLTVNGVEQGQKLASTTGYELVFEPGTYMGEVVLTVTDANPVSYTPAGPPDSVPEPLVHPFRQAICVEELGLVEFKSVLAAIAGAQPDLKTAKGLTITSTGECFNGIYAAGSYTVDDVEINLTGNGRSDFSGYGTAVVGTGERTTLVLDRVNILTAGVVRAGVVATNGANVIVKNSDIQTSNGELPSDYVPTIDTAQMRSVPWMLGLSGNVRATNLLGINTKASYINSTISSEGWGVLSTDGCTTPTLTAINSTIRITGDDGYGSYGIGDATEHFLGCNFDVATYASISRGSYLFYGDSTPEKVAELSTNLNLGLTPAELAAIPNQGTVVNSRRFGVMWHGGGTLDISGHTEFNTREAVFLDKGQAIKITVEGPDVKLNPENDIIMQFMDDDDPGPDPATMQNTGTYSDPSTPPEVDTAHDLTRAVDGSDALVTFKNIELTGDFYNSTRGGLVPAASVPMTSGGTTTTAGAAAAGATTTLAPTTTAPPATTAAPPADGGAATTVPEMVSISKNLVLNFDNVKITGVITASTAVHVAPSPSSGAGTTTTVPVTGATTTTVPVTTTTSQTTTTVAGSETTTTTLAPVTITAVDYRFLGTVINTPAQAINNGVVVVLANGSVWTVTGTSYLTSLTIGEGCSVTVRDGQKLTVKVDGKKVKKLAAGPTYMGKIELIVEGTPLPTTTTVTATTTTS